MTFWKRTWQERQDEIRRVFGQIWLQLTQESEQLVEYR